MKEWAANSVFTNESKMITGTLFQNILLLSKYFCVYKVSSLFVQQLLTYSDGLTANETLKPYIVKSKCVYDCIRSLEPQTTIKLRSYVFQDIMA